MLGGHHHHGHSHGDDESHSHDHKVNGIEGLGVLSFFLTSITGIQHQSQSSGTPRPWRFTRIRR